MVCVVLFQLVPQQFKLCFKQYDAWNNKSIYRLRLSPAFSFSPACRNEQCGPQVVKFTQTSTNMQHYNDEGHASQLSDANLRRLLTDSRKAKENSYSPYSKFRVGCALLTESGEFYSGCNVENASYGLSICAERTALVKAVSDGHQKFKAIAVTTDLDYLVYPCGACRQFISEFGEMEVFVSSESGEWKLLSVEKLLPFSFRQGDLTEYQRKLKTSNST